MAHPADGGRGIKAIVAEAAALPPLAAGDLGRGNHRLRAAFDAELLQDRRDVGLDGRLRYAEFIGDLLVEQSFRQHHQHPHLLRGQRHQSVAQTRQFRIGLRRQVRIRRHPDVAVEHLHDRIAQRVDAKSFGDEAGRAEIERLTNGSAVVAGRDDHHRNRRELRPKVNQSGKA